MSRCSASRNVPSRKVTFLAKPPGPRSRSQTAPPPLSRTTFDPATDFYALTPEHAAYCRALWDTNAMYTKGMFTPPTLDRTMVMFPSTLGGGNWSGLSYDDSRGLVFTNIMNLGQVARMEPPYRQQARRGPLSTDDTVGPADRTVLESREPGALLHAAVRRAPRR